MIRFALPLRTPLITRTTTLTRREGLLLVLETDAGIRGFGEASPLEAFGSESLEEAESALLEAAGRLLGKAPIATGAEDDAGPAPCDRPCARAAFDSARLDLAARCRGVPLAVELARESDVAAADRIEVNTLLPEAPLDRLVAAARCARAEGFRTLKVKLLGPTLDADLARIGAVRDEVGSGLRLRADAAAALSKREALELCCALEPFDLEYLEQPLPADDVAGLADLRRRSPVPIAADEAAANPARARAVIEARAADLLVLKPTLCGGPRLAISLARLARSAGLDVVVTSALESAVGLSVALHVAAALGPPRRACGLATGSLLADDLAPGPDIELGAVRLPSAPGLGFDPDPDALSRLGSCVGEIAR